MTTQRPTTQAGTRGRSSAAPRVPAGGVLPALPPSGPPVVLSPGRAGDRRLEVRARGYGKTAAAALSIEALVAELRAREDHPLVAALELPVRDWDGTRLSANDRYPTVKLSRGRQIQPEKNRRTSYWRELALVKARGLRLKLSVGRVEIVYRYPDNIRREVANLQPTSKAIVDGLVDAGIFPDDKDGVLVGPDNRRDPVNGPHAVTVLVYGR